MARSADEIAADIAEPMLEFATRIQSVLGKLKASTEEGINAQLDPDESAAVLDYMDAVDKHLQLLGAK